jgi:hypothetical protein
MHFLRDEVIDQKKKRACGRWKGAKQPQGLVFGKNECWRLLGEFLKKGSSISGLDVMEVA